MKIEINKVAEILKKNSVEPTTIRAVVEEMNTLTQTDTDVREPSVRKQYAILLSDPDGLLRGYQLAAWVLQLPETESPLSVQERIIRAAHDFNTTRKGRLYPAETVGDALENVPAKHFKESNLWVKTKTPLVVIRTNNQIPRGK